MFWRNEVDTLSFVSWYTAFTSCYLAIRCEVDGGKKLVRLTRASRQEFLMSMTGLGSKIKD